jgi:hypothetical protein
MFPPHKNLESSLPDLSTGGVRFEAVRVTAIMTVCVGSLAPKTCRSHGLLTLSDSPLSPKRRGFENFVDPIIDIAYLKTSSSWEDDASGDY